MPYKPITAIIYDFDGLLFNTEPIHAQVNRAIAARYSKVFDLSIQTQIIGRTAADSARIIIEMLDLPLTVDEYLLQKSAIIYDLYPQAKPMPGAVELTCYFHDQGVPQAIASSTSQKPFASKTTHYRDWVQRFEYIVLSDDPDLKSGKPAPDCFLLAAKRLKTPPDACLVFEDSVAGVVAAKRAGMSVVAIPAPQMDKQLFWEADEILTSLWEFQPQDWSLPCSQGTGIK